MLKERHVDALVDFMLVPAEGDVNGAVVPVADGQNSGQVECDVAVVGGGVGGVAAALAAAREGKRVCLIEETDWLGGQVTAQGVSALDEHEYIESFGGTSTYYHFRDALRDRYRSQAGSEALHFNPGSCWVSRLAFEPAAAVSVIEALLRPYCESGQMNVLLRTKVFAAETEGDHIKTVKALSFADGERWCVAAAVFIDATELGDLLPLTGTEYQVGAEAVGETGEAHAQPEESKPRCVQSFTYISGLERRSFGEKHIVARPSHYEKFRQSQPYSLKIEVHGGEIYGEESGWLQYRIFEAMPGTKGSLWDYRRLIDAENFPTFSHDLSIINWPGNDYRDSTLIDSEPLDVARTLQNAKRVSLGFLHWVQTEGEATAERRGAPELMLQPSIMGSQDGLSKYPYIREARRIKALRTVVEQDVSTSFQPGVRAAHFADSVGIGWYPIDIHRSGPEDVGVSCRTRPFQIPLGALLPKRTANLVAAAKNIGTTHITNGCYRLHPVEWNIGEVAGQLSAYAIDEALPLHRVHNDPRHLRRFQDQLLARGIPLAWLLGMPPDSRGFAVAQRLFMDGRLRAEDDLSLHPNDLIQPEEWSRWGGIGDIPSSRGAALEMLARA